MPKSVLERERHTVPDRIDLIQCRSKTFPLTLDYDCSSRLQPEEAASINAESTSVPFLVTLASQRQTRLQGQSPLVAAMVEEQLSADGSVHSLGCSLHIHPPEHHCDSQHLCLCL